MKLEITRGIFLVAALSVTAIATAAWQEPAPRIVLASDCNASEAPCPKAPKRTFVRAQAEVDGNLLLLMYGLSHAMKADQ